MQLDKYLKWGMVGGIVGAVTYGISRLYGMVFSDGIANIKLASPLNLNIASNLQSGLDLTAGEKIFGLLNGLSMPGSIIIQSVIVGAILMIVGRFLFDLFKLRPGSLTQKFMYVLFLGWLVFAVWAGMVTASLSVEMASLLLTMLVYYFIVGFISVYLLKQLNYKIPE